jgi:3'(2'), 5'-bisphosphate nucleotidase
MLCDMMDQRQTEMNIALAAARCAARVCVAVQRRHVTPETIEKRDRSPVTVADFASQAVVCATLAEAFPNDPVVGEENAGALREASESAVRRAVLEQVRAAIGDDVDESQVLDWIDRGAAAGDSDRYWTVDPIDGTKGFLRREQYAVALALIERGRVVLGVLACPNLGDGGVLAAAIDGQGSKTVPLDGEWQDGTSIAVRALRDPAAGVFCESVESGHSDQSASQQIAAKLGITAQPVRMDSQAKYATVARGDADIYLRLPTRADYREKIWDHAAGQIVIEQAGGKVTDVDGKPLDYSHGRTFAHNRGVVATSGAIHEAVLAAVKDVLGG